MGVLEELEKIFNQNNIQELHKFEEKHEYKLPRISTNSKQDTNKEMHTQTYQKQRQTENLESKNRKMINHV